ncbi:MAG: DUF362 domain-containing protein [Clostridia bacterium]
MNFDAAIVPCLEYTPDAIDAAMDSVIEKIGGLDFIKPGMKIAIKANLVMLKKPDSAATTHPSLLIALTKRIIARGASVVVGDSPGGPFTYPWIKSIYLATGMGDVEKAGASLNKNMGVEIANAHGERLSDFSYTAYLAEADFIINFAKLKTHGMMAMTGAVKNMFGTIPGTQKPEYHYNFSKSDDFANVIIDIYEYFKPVISFVDAVIGMEGNGPTAGTPRHIGALIASKSAFSADLIGASIIGLDSARVPILREGIRRGICAESLDRLNIFGDPETFKINDYKLMDAVDDLGFKTVFEFSDRFLAENLRSRPVVNPKICVGCAVCFNTCPAHAITMISKCPSFDYGKCIRCCCCQEFCKVGAITVKRPLIARILTRGRTP